MSGLDEDVRRLGLSRIPKAACTARSSRRRADEHLLRAAAAGLAPLHRLRARVELWHFYGARRRVAHVLDDAHTLVTRLGPEAPPGVVPPACGRRRGGRRRAGAGAAARWRRRSTLPGRCGGARAVRACRAAAACRRAGADAIFPRPRLRALPLFLLAPCRAASRRRRRRRPRRRRRHRAAAPAKLDKPPKLLRFVEATPPAALAERGQVDVVLTIDVDEAARSPTSTVAKSARRRLRRGGASRRRASSCSRPARPAASRCRCASPTAIASSTRRRRRRPAAAAPQRARRPRRRCRSTASCCAKGERLPLPGVSVSSTAARARSPTTTAASTSTLPAGEHTVHAARPDVASAADVKLTLTAGKRARGHLVRRAAASATPRRARRSASCRRPSSRRSPATRSSTSPARRATRSRRCRTCPAWRARRSAAALLVVWGSAPQRHAHLRRRRLHPDAVSLRRPALDGEQRDGRRR